MYSSLNKYIRCIQQRSIQNTRAKHSMKDAPSSDEKAVKSRSIERMQWGRTQTINVCIDRHDMSTTVSSCLREKSKADSSCRP